MVNIKFGFFWTIHSACETKGIYHDWTYLFFFVQGSKHQIEADIPVAPFLTFFSGSEGSPSKSCSTEKKLVLVF